MVEKNSLNKKIYDDVFHPSANETGQVLALLPQAIKAALLPLRKWIIQKEYNYSEIEKIMAQKLENVDCEKIVTPEPYVAIPALQAMSYAMDSQELRNLYAGLLAKSMNIDTKNDVHPAFTFIIQQLSPLEVKILENIFIQKSFPVVSLRASRYPNKDYFQTPLDRYEFDFITPVDFVTPLLVAGSFDNLLRLKLIEEKYSFENQIPEEIKATSFYKKAITDLSPYIENSAWTFESTVSHFSLSNLGIRFHKICVE